MKVCFLVKTEFNGEVFEKDSIHELREDFAYKWIRRGVASIIPAKDLAQDDKEVVEVKEAVEISEQPKQHHKEVSGNHRGQRSRNKTREKEDLL